ncbi:MULTISPECIES: cell envelope integrity protein TolA [unclassified Serratia (in: enterobacteria)]|uniref:cell envelope integrity protein TolA n=1 Tax=unclassified Serratia (in: enterobacteria) TaxID=2647522 RepID=UPI00046AEF67|nr:MULTISPECIES: cell envelope integrity protein TolA [unclassified Serratia (in: enterobacteria)]
MKKLTSVCLGCLLFVSACSPHKSTRTQPIELQPQEMAPFVDKTTYYLRAIQTAIQRKFFIGDNYRGKTCDVTIKMSKDGLIYDAQGSGYPPLCEAALKAIKNADIPAPPDDETYQRIKKTIITFQPD